MIAFQWGNEFIWRVCVQEGNDQGRISETDEKAAFTSLEVGPVTHPSSDTSTSDALQTGENGKYPCSLTHQVIRSTHFKVRVRCICFLRSHLDVSEKNSAATGLEGVSATV